MDKTPCKDCGALILPSTAARTDGLCMPCKNGTRKQIDEGIAWHKRERELEKSCPFRALWRSLHNKVYSRDEGIGVLSPVERTYWVLNILEGEIYNGGFDQYFYNSSGSTYGETISALSEIDARDARALLERAKGLIFGELDVPIDVSERRRLMLALWPDSSPPEIDAIDREYWDQPSPIRERLEQYAFRHGLVDPVEVERVYGVTDLAK